jgi:hypothetical protein
MVASECPYVKYRIRVWSHSYSTAQTRSACHIRVKVLRTFPFTKSQTIEVAILNKSHGYKKYLPSIAFLKLYDRRFLDDRSAFGDDPWDYGKEAKAKEIHQIFQPHVCRA